MTVPRLSTMGGGSLLRDRLDVLAEQPRAARRWLPRVTTRVVRSQARILRPLGKGPTAQVARVLTDEAVDGRIRAPQRALAAMLGSTDHPEQRC